MLKKRLIFKQKRKMCKIFTKYKLKHQFAQKLLSLGVSVSLMAATVPQMAWAAEPTTFVASAKANHWGRSDLRAYLNNVTKTDNTLPIYTTSAGNGANYPSQFSAAEFGLVEPFTYSTNVRDSSGNATATYETSDRFWLPSGNLSSSQVISWGREDISASAQYGATTTSDKARIIPISYWSRIDSISYSWLRSPDYNYSDCALRAYRGNDVIRSSVHHAHAAACAFKIDLSSVIFASAASAASIAGVEDAGADRISISGSSDFGKKTSTALPDYGMYLKTKADSGVTFDPTDIALSGTNLTVTYTGGVANQYVVVHAFMEDSLTAGHDSCVAAGKISSQNSSITINVSGWGLSSLDDCTIKVWMEEGSKGSSLAKATTPVTFVGSEKTDEGASTNLRVFAMKDELKCSWGDLSALSDDDFSKVLSGTATTETSGITGKNPTNQKIYFGSYEDTNDGNTVKPLEFWIAGRETAANGGTISDSGEIMTLYQAKSVETKQFNGNSSDYTVADKAAITLQLADGLSTSYTGSPVSYPELEQNVTFSGQDGLQNEALQWQHRSIGVTAWSTGMPTKAGSYEIRCYAAGTDNYERTYSAPVTFKVIGTPTADDFDFTAPSPSVYDGSPKTATVTAKSSVSGMGAVTVKYYDESGNNPAVGSDTSTAPTNAGTYTVKIDVAEGDNYKSAIDLTSESWKFTIAKATPTVPSGLTAIYGQTLSEITIPAGWAWDSPSDPVGNVGQQSHSATFTPSDPDNYISVTENLTVSVTPDTSSWGTETEVAGISHWTAANGTTSVEVTENGMIWLKEESGGASAWYGIDNSAGVFEIGSRFWVRWLNRDSDSDEFENLWEQLDDEVKDSIDGDNAWLFEIGVTSPDGTAYSDLSPSVVPVYVQIGDDWDKADLQGYYVSAAQDEQVRTIFVDNQNYPEGQDTFGIMELKHFSPYFIYDKLTDEEKAAQNQVKTGDQVSLFTISGLGLTMTLALGLMLSTNSNKRKFDE